MAKDFILVQKFYLQLEAMEKISLFLELIDKKGKGILILAEGPSQRLDDTILTAEAKHPISFIQSKRTYGLSLHYNGRDNFLFLDATKTY